MVSGMPHILDYCGAIALSAFAQTSSSNRRTTQPLILRKLQTIPFSVKINNTTIESRATDSLVYSNTERTTRLKINFETPYMIDLDLQLNDVGNTFYHVYTPFDVWGIDTFVLEFIGINHNPTATMNVDVIDDSTDLQPINPATQVFSHTVYEHNKTCMRLLFTCEHDPAPPGMPMYDTHHDVTSISIQGIEFEYDRSHNMSNMERGIVTIIAVFSCMLCGPVVASLNTVFSYKLIVFLADRFDTMYRERRRVDW